jgi:hypothetical protein
VGGGIHGVVASTARVLFMKLAARLVAVGAILVVAGVAILHWPTAIIVAGIMIGAAGLFLDLDEV